MAKRKQSAKSTSDEDDATPRALPGAPIMDCAETATAMQALAASQRSLSELPADFVPPMGISREAWWRHHVQRQAISDAKLVKPKLAL